MKGKRAFTNGFKVRHGDGGGSGGTSNGETTNFTFP